MYPPPPHHMQMHPQYAQAHPGYHPHPSQHGHLHPIFGAPSHHPMMGHPHAMQPLPAPNRPGCGDPYCQGCDYQENPRDHRVNEDSHPNNESGTESKQNEKSEGASNRSPSSDHDEMKDGKTLQTPYTRGEQRGVGGPRVIQPTSSGTAMNNANKKGVKQNSGSNRQFQTSQDRHNRASQKYRNQDRHYAHHHNQRDYHQNHELNPEEYEKQYGVRHHEDGQFRSPPYGMHNAGMQGAQRDYTYSDNRSNSYQAQSARNNYHNDQLQQQHQERAAHKKQTPQIVAQTTTNTRRDLKTNAKFTAAMNRTLQQQEVLAGQHLSSSAKQSTTFKRQVKDNSQQAEAHHLARMVAPSLSPAPRSCTEVLTSNHKSGVTMLADSVINPNAVPKDANNDSVLSADRGKGMNRSPLQKVEKDVLNTNGQQLSNKRVIQSNNMVVQNQQNIDYQKNAMKKDLNNQDNSDFRETPRSLFGRKASQNDHQNQNNTMQQQTQNQSNAEQYMGHSDQEGDHDMRASHSNTQIKQSVEYLINDIHAGFDTQNHRQSSTNEQQLNTQHQNSTINISHSKKSKHDLTSNAQGAQLNIPTTAMDMHHRSESSGMCLQENPTAQLTSKSISSQHSPHNVPTSSVGVDHQQVKSQLLRQCQQQDMEEVKIPIQIKNQDSYAQSSSHPLNLQSEMQSSSAGQQSHASSTSKKQKQSPPDYDSGKNEPAEMLKLNRKVHSATAQKRNNHSSAKKESSEASADLTFRKTSSDADYDKMKASSNSNKKVPQQKIIIPKFLLPNLQGSSSDRSPSHISQSPGHRPLKNTLTDEQVRHLNSTIKNPSIQSILQETNRPNALDANSVSPQLPVIPVPQPFMISNAASYKPCNCRRTGCFKLYCDCLRAGLLCSDKCKCYGCKNREPNEQRDKLLNLVKAKVDFSSPSPHHGSSLTPTRGCHCKRSGCLKNYCECFQKGQPCSTRCLCNGCQNTNMSYIMGRRFGHGTSTPSSGGNSTPVKQLWDQSPKHSSSHGHGKGLADHTSKWNTGSNDQDQTTTNINGNQLAAVKEPQNNGHESSNKIDHHHNHHHQRSKTHTHNHQHKRELSDNPSREASGPSAMVALNISQCDQDAPMTSSNNNSRQLYQTPTKIMGQQALQKVTKSTEKPLKSQYLDNDEGREGMQRVDGDEDMMSMRMDDRQQRSNNTDGQGLGKLNDKVSSIDQQSVQDRRGEEASIRQPVAAQILQVQPHVSNPAQLGHSQQNFQQEEAHQDSLHMMNSGSSLLRPRKAMLSPFEGQSHHSSSNQQNQSQQSFGAGGAATGASHKTWQVQQSSTSSHKKPGKKTEALVVGGSQPPAVVRSPPENDHSSSSNTRSHRANRGSQSHSKKAATVSGAGDASSQIRTRAQRCKKSDSTPPAQI